MDFIKAEQGTRRLGYLHTRFLEAVRKCDSGAIKSYAEFISAVLNSNFIVNIEVIDEVWISLFCFVLGIKEQDLYGLLAEDLEQTPAEDFGERFNSFWKTVQHKAGNTE